MKRQGGFTIIEVSLFLAISAALLLLMAGLYSLVSRQRFQDTMTSLRTTIQSEYEEVRSGINPRLGGENVTGCGLGQATGTSGNCLAIGKLIRLGPTGADGTTDASITINYVVAKNIPADIGNLADQDALAAVELYAVGAGGSSYQVRANDVAAQPQITKIQQGGTFVNGWTIPDGNTTDPSNVNGLAILRSPASSAILVFALKNSAVNASSGQLSLAGANATYNIPVAFMIDNAYTEFDGAAVCIDRGSSSSAVRTAIPTDPTRNFTMADLNELRQLCGV